MKKILILLITVLLVSCEKDNKKTESEIEFTNKWWQSTENTDILVRFEKNGTYKKIVKLDIEIPSIYPISGSLFEITGKWKKEGEEIFFETVEVEQDTTFLNLIGNSVSSFYGYEDLWDNNDLTGTILNLFNGSNDSIADMVKFWFPDMPLDSVSIVSSIVGGDQYITFLSEDNPEVWVISKITKDQLIVTVNGKEEIYKLSRDFPK